MKDSMPRMRTVRDYLPKGMIEEFVALRRIDPSLARAQFLAFLAALMEANQVHKDYDPAMHEALVKVRDEVMAGSGDAGLSCLRI